MSECEWCDNVHVGICPRITAIEYYENGARKRVELLGTRLEGRECNRCGGQFYIGAGGRQPHAKFCSNKCRVDYNNAKRLGNPLKVTA